MTDSEDHLTEASRMERAWVAVNYSQESKRRVAAGEEATPADRAKWATALENEWRP